MTLQGYDVSAWQSGAYAGSGGFSFGFAKASEGWGFKDPGYDRHISAIKASGIIPGAYHFARSDLGSTPEQEADWFLSVVGDPEGMLLALDLEVGSGNLAYFRDRFHQRILDRLGYHAGWYSYRVFIATRALNYGGPDWLWLAWPTENGPLPQLNTPVVMQQWGLTSVPGIPGGVDANSFPGTINQLAALTVGGGRGVEEVFMSGGSVTIQGRSFVAAVTKEGRVALAGSPGGMGGLWTAGYLLVPGTPGDVWDVWLGADEWPAGTPRLLIFCVDASGTLYGAAVDIEPLNIGEFRPVAGMNGIIQPGGPPGPVGPPGPQGEPGPASAVVPYHEHGGPK